MTNDITPYSSPNPVDAMLDRQARSKTTLPVGHFRTAEILACLQTMHEELAAVAKLSRRRACAVESWLELAGDVVSVLPVQRVNLSDPMVSEPVDPFEVAKRDFPPSGNPREFRTNLPLVLQYMVNAARHAVGHNQRYTDNYHGVICFQCMQHGLVTPHQCMVFHHDVIQLPVPVACPSTGLVYRPDYSPDHPPRGSEEDLELSEFDKFSHH